MDPLSTLEVVSNVLAVMDFAWTLLSEARTIYKSSNDTSTEAYFIKSIVRDIQQLDEGISSSHAGNTGLQALMKLSRDIATELLDALATVKTSGQRSKLRSLVASLKEA